MDKKIRRAAKSAKPLKIIDFLQAAFDDYIAARVLIRAGLLPQGAILASTAIEKYCKTVLAFQGQSNPGHLKLPIGIAYVVLIQNFIKPLMRNFLYFFKNVTLSDIPMLY